MDAKVSILQAFKKYYIAHKYKDAPIGIVQARHNFVHLYNTGAINCGAETFIKTISAVTLARWQKLVSDHGVSALNGNYGKTRGQTIIDQNPAIKGYILAILQQTPHVSAKHIIRALRANFAQMYIDGDLPSYRTVQHWLGCWKNTHRQLHLFATNPDAWKSKYRAASGTAAEAIIRLNQLWEMDSTPADILCADGRRYQIIGCIDVYSRRLKLLVHRTSNAAAIAGLLRKCITDWGIPEAVKTDNGKDYISTHLRRIFAALNITHHTCRPFSPEQKPHIERAFKTFHHDILELLPGFTGHNVAERQDLQQVQAFAKRFGKPQNPPTSIGSVLRPTAFLTVDRLQDFCDRWCDSLYAHDAHRGLGGKTPWHMANTYTGEVRTPKTPRTLDILLLPAAGGGGVRTVTKKGISVNNAPYDCPELGGLEGKQVKVLLSQDDWGVVFIFDLNDTYICTAKSPQRQGVSIKQVATARKNRQAEWLKQQRTEMQALTKHHNIKDTATDILNHAEGLANKMVAFPTTPTPVSTDTLDKMAFFGSASPDGDCNRDLSGIHKQHQMSPQATFDTINKSFQRVKNQIAVGRCTEPIYNSSRANDTGTIAASRSNDPIDNVVALPESPQTRYNKWLALASKIQSGDSLPEYEHKWYTLYQQSAEFKSQQNLKKIQKGI